MSNKIFHNLPFNAKKLVKNEGTLDRCDLKTSISQNLRLLLMTPPLRLRFAPFYGSKIHFYQFVLSNRLMQDNPDLEDNFKIKVEKNVKALVEKYEKRIQVTEVIVNIRYAPKQDEKWRFSRVKRTNNSIIQVIVNIKGKITPQYILDGQSLVLKDTIPLL